MPARKSVTSLKGKTIANVTSNGGYYTLHLVSNLSGKSAGQITVHTDSAFDKDGMLFEDNAPSK